MFGKTLARALTMATIVSLLMSSVALADTLETDTDGDDATIAIANSNIAFGTVCEDAAESQQILLVVKRQGGSAGATFKNSSGVTFTYVAAGGSQKATGAMDNNPSQVTLPADWETAPAGGTEKLSDYVTATVTLDTSTAGSFGGNVTFRATGTNRNNTAMADDVTVTWSATIAAATDAACGGDTEPVDPCLSVLSPEAPVFSPNSTDANAYGWFTTAPAVSATSATSGATITYSIDGGVTFGGAPTLSDGTTTVIARATTATCGKTADTTEIFYVDTTGPVITYVGQDKTGWTNGSVVLSWTCSDTVSGVVASPVTQTISTEGIAQQATGTCTNGAGLTSQSTNGAADIDKTNPTITFSGQNPTGWTNGSVELTWTCSDGLSGVVNATVKQTITTEGQNQQATGTCHDNAGNSSSNLNGDADIDKTNPLISATLDRAPNATTGWFNIGTGAPIVDYTCSDGLSGLAGTCPDHTFGEGENQSHSTTVYDNAGNSNSAGVSNVDVDLTAPALNISGAANGTFNVCAGSLPSQPTFAPTDNLSGIASSDDSWVTPTTASGVGTYLYTAEATDGAGNLSSGGRTYSVNYGTAGSGGAFSGVLQPVNADGSSRFKTGSTVPIKFRLMCGTTSISDAVAALTVRRVDGTPDPGEQEVVSTAASTTGNLFRYSADGAQYIFNLNTKAPYTYTNTGTGQTTSTSFSAGTYQFTITLDSGEKFSFNFQLVK